MTTPAPAFDPWQDLPARRPAPVWLPWAGVAAGALGLLGVATLMLGLLEDTPGPVRQTVQVTLVRPPPPPPKTEPPPEPPRPREEVRLTAPQPKPEPVQAPRPVPESPAAVTAPEGAGAADGFGLRTGPPSDGPVVGAGQSGAGDRDLLARLQAHLDRALGREDGLRARPYRVVVRLWIDDIGAVTRAELADGSGDALLDARLREALERIRGVPDARVLSQRAPIRVRLTSVGGPA